MALGGAGAPIQRLLLVLESCPDTSSCRSRQHLLCLGPCGPCGLRGPLSRFAVHRGAALKRVNGCPFCRLRRAGHSPRVTSRPLGGRHVVRAADIISRSANRRKGQDDSDMCRRTTCFTAHATPPWLACADLAQMAHTGGVTRLRARSIAAAEPDQVATIVRREIGALRVGEREYDVRHRRSAEIVARAGYTLGIIERVVLPSDVALARKPSMRVARRRAADCGAGLRGRLRR